MKMTSVLLLACSVLAVPALADTTWVVCGSPNMSNTIPFCGQTTDAVRFQILYLQSEINCVGEIVAFELASAGSAPSEFYNVRVSLCHTPDTTLDTVFANNYGGNTPQLVLSADTLLVGSADTWYNLPCSYQYNDTDNLLFEIQWRGDAGSNVNFYRNTNIGTNYRRAWKIGNDTAAVGQRDLVQAYYARIGFLTTGIAEGGNSRVAGPELDVRPSVGRDFAIRYPAATGSNVGIEVRDAAGRAVARLPAKAGGETVWHAAAAPAGVYLVRATIGGQTLRRQVVVPASPH
jgi:hypothetical protein